MILTLSPGSKEDVTHLFLVCARALALPGSLALVAQLVKNPPAMQETWVQSLGREDSPGEGESYSLQYSGLENSMDYIVHGVAKSQTPLGDFHFIFLFKKWKIKPFQTHVKKLQWAT